ncbi:hypothetical protein I6L78_03710 [Proteus vulgaris]|jgi:hypothetical protein|uniref:hypothetical protein n=1 Tax=Proteus vulgaris TaxID=585 RepID=UPI0013D8D944|nr:hypothetical protein [Proteus vulgaris]MBW3471233.1 hypothetical protein [Proteus vulgaris]MCH4254305.1 hypothetical protein [Proteus vulgaris]
MIHIVIFFRKVYSLIIKNNFFVELIEKEVELIFSDLKNKNDDINKLKTIESLNLSVDSLKKDIVEENIYEEIDNDCYLSEKLE